MKAILGNIVNLDVDVIVNTANSKLIRGSGVCGTIHKNAGPMLEIDCKKIGYCEPGSSVITQGYGLNHMVERASGIPNCL